MKRRWNQDRVIVTRSYTAAAATAASSNNSSSEPPPCLKLIADCWEHIFDYLAMQDIQSIGQTCKRMHRMAGWYFREYFPELEYRVCESVTRFYIRSNPCYYEVNPMFYQFISKLKIRQRLDRWSSDGHTFSSLKTLIFKYTTLTANEIKRRRNLFENVESLHIIKCRLSGDIFQPISILCPKLTYLNVDQPIGSYTVKNYFFSQYYPHLKHFRYEPEMGDHDIRIDQLETFLKKHSNINRITTNFRFLWTHRDVFVATNIQVGILTTYFDVPFGHVQVDEVFALLKRLFERGFYKSLHLSFGRRGSYLNNRYEKLSNAVAMVPALQKFSARDHKILDLYCLTNLKEFHMSGEGCSAEDTEKMAKSLINLEVLTNADSPIDIILPFICHSKKLKKLFAVLKSHSGRALDLVAFNEQRTKLSNARKVAIYVQDGVYLPTKWSHTDINLSHIKIIRSNLHHHTYYPY